MAALPPLSATIASIALFTKQDPVTFDMPIVNYHGERLFCKAFIDSGSLNILIDDTGPSTPPIPVPNDINRATVTVKYSTQQAGPVAIGDFVYRGQHMLLSAVLSASGSALRLTLQESASPNGAPGQPPNDIAVGYVLVAADNGPTQGLLELRWVDVPVKLAAQTTQARVRPKPPEDGAGVSGPIGLQTP